MLCRHFGSLLDVDLTCMAEPPHTSVPRPVISSCMQAKPKPSQAPGCHVMKSCKRQRICSSVPNVLDANDESVSRSVNAVELDANDYECPVCMEPMIAQIMQCDAGHTICKRCVDKMIVPRAYPPTLLIGYGWNHKLAVARAKV